MANEQETLRFDAAIDDFRSRLPAHTSIQPDESFSSWVVRVAERHGMSVQFLNHWLMGRGRQLFAEDADRGAWQDFHHRIAMVTGLQPDDIRESTLRRYEGILWGILPLHGHARWVIPLGKHGTARHGFGLQYCAKCLRDDETPYLRLRWRLAFSVCCPIHGELLSDRCPCCKQAVAPHRWGCGRIAPADTSGITHCECCGSDRRQFADQGIACSQDLVTAQREIEATMAVGFATVFGRQTCLLSYFAGLGILLSYMDCTERSRLLWEYLGLELPRKERARLRESRYFESGVVHQRASLLHALSALRLSEPELLPAALVASGTKSSDLTRPLRRGREEMPFWLWQCMQNGVNKAPYVPSDEEIVNAIRYQVRKDAVGRTRIRDVCALLGLSTNNSARVARAMYSLNVVARSRRVAQSQPSPETALLHQKPAVQI